MRGVRVYVLVAKDRIGLCACVCLRVGLFAWGEERMDRIG